MKRYINGLKKRYPKGLVIQTERGIATVISIDHRGRIVAACGDRIICLVEVRGQLILTGSPTA